MILFTIFLTSCATTAKYEEMLNTWLGHSSSELMSSFGPPDSTFDDGIGNKFYVYSRTGDTFGSVIPNGYGGGVVMTTTNWCKTIFTINSDGRVSFWRWEGNSCKAK